MSANNLKRRKLGNFEGYVLAGGKSSRMKTDKAFLEFGGTTFLERAINALEPICNEVKIVINENQKTKFEIAFPSFDFIFDVRASRGALGGIHAALKNCASDWAVILATDLPLVTSETIDSLTRIAGESETDFVAAAAAAAVVPHQSDGAFQPLCAVYRVGDCLPVVEKLLSERVSVSMRDFLQFIPVRFVETGELTNSREELLFLNVNNPFDYEDLKTSFHQL